MKRKISILLIVTIFITTLFTACGGYTEPSETPIPVSTPAPLAEQQIPDDNGDPFEYTVCGAISDNMVFQRDKYINVYGESDKVGAYVYADFDGETRWGEVDENGKWLIQFNPRSACTDPRSLAVYSKAQGVSGGYVFENILIGDVWMAGGQSNMQVFLSDTIKNNPEFENEIDENQNIRLFTQWYDDRCEKEDELVENKPYSDVPKGRTWLVNNKDNAYNFAAVAYYFAKTVEDNVDVPIGLIQASAGGAAIKDFIPADKFTDTYNHGPTIYAPSYIFNIMYNAFTQTNIKGFLWYQGEADETVSEYYGQDFTDFVGMMREIWGEDIPFLSVQISSHSDECDMFGLPDIRLVQFDCLGKIDNYYLTTSIDYGVNELDDDWAHPKNKKPVGDRLAWLALSKIYAPDKYSISKYGSPQMAKVEMNGNTARVYFKYVGDGLKTVSGGKAVYGFTALSTGVVLDANIVGKNCVEVSLLNRAGANIGADGFAYAYSLNPNQANANLQNSEGIGALSFKFEK